MKILFCTNVFEVVENGPVKFANLLLQINELYPEHELHILTEDVSGTRPFVHPVELPELWKSSFLSQFARMWFYHRAAMRVRETFHFDILVYNNALVGLWSALQFPNCVGMINDYKNISPEKDHYQNGRRSLKEKIFRMLEKISAAYYWKIVANSDYLTCLIQDAYPRSRGKVFRLYKGVELPAMPVRLPKVLAQPVKILFIKTDYELGGLGVLIQAASLLNHRVVLTVIGPKEAHRQRIEKWAANAANLTLRFRGYRPQQEVVMELRASHVFCVPSYKEALGVANLEAMAHGIPVVSTSVGGIPEVLDGGRCGWLVPPGHAPALAEAIEECVTQPALRAAKVRNALQRVQQFDARLMYHDFLEILLK